MKDIFVILLASLIISYILIVLVLADRGRDSTSWRAVLENQEGISHVALRVIFGR
jgi:hypothetical protein